MKKIFEQGEFSNYKVRNIEKSAGPILESVYKFAEAVKTVFISHKHDDLDDLEDVIGFLEKEYKIKAYIDSQDSSMPKTTSGVTATRIKDRIRKCDKFILLATNGAIDSKWCNWELGYGDAQKFESKNIALFPMKAKGEINSSYKGNEYMSIYPYIVYYDGTERYSNDKLITRGYYVRTEREDGTNYITPLSEWLNK